MKTNYQLTARQLVLLALTTAIFAASVVIFSNIVVPNLLGKFAGADPEKKAPEVGKVEGLTDPSVATDETNNREIYDAVSPGVVNITSTVLVQDFFLNVYPQKGSGSGSIIDKEGRILTNYHVIEEADEVEVTLSNKNSYRAKVLGSDPDNDLAVIKIDAPAAEITPVPLGDSEKVFVGQKVLAIGNPFGFDRTLTTGVISGVERPLKSEITGRLIEGAIQTDAAINRGNSGGPLLNSRGQMIGINTMIFSPSGGSIGIGFAVPVKTAKRVIQDILQYGRVRKPSLGITSIELTPRLSRAIGLSVNEGLLVQEAFSDGAAAKAGLKGGTERARLGDYIILLGGDIIVGVDGKAINKRDDLDHILNNKNVGDRINVEVVRGGRKLTLPVQLSELSRAARRRI
jgi:S1-C subfamily serine protease